jgi:hypothetical protein
MFWIFLEKGICEFFGFCSGVVEVSAPLSYDTTSLDTGLLCHTTPRHWTLGSSVIRHHVTGHWAPLSYDTTTLDTGLCHTTPRHWTLGSSVIRHHVTGHWAPLSYATASLDTGLLCHTPPRHWTLGSSVIRHRVTGHWAPDFSRQRFDPIFRGLNVQEVVSDVSTHTVSRNV